MLIAAIFLLVNSLLLSNISLSFQSHLQQRPVTNANSCVFFYAGCLLALFDSLWLNYGVADTFRYEWCPIS
ncbi:hypothetical protein K450DRAFT_229521 [Umbelopsis ramanniana AG]|uniref:Uncharacterized protein n=1 Tax=Umbelopsis ramanniana AG TaxID=1314678 RepID=A0AAD5HEY8_UMBRA|nr:uncharacterized protein K450DRAFT_229521 [Umbelopsis ramanniana AG]KAI8581852.1 hypothetical protein K450DRAFT_229521 [Umbelopsis ramanniana AG]